MNTSCGGSDPNEQITVNTASPGMTTQASPTSATVGVGITVTDTATRAAAAAEIHQAGR